MNCTTNNLLYVRLTPNAKKAGVDGLWNQTHWRIRVQAPAVDGKANEALIDFLSQELHLPKKFFEITAGQTSRLKTIKIHAPVEIPWKK